MKLVVARSIEKIYGQNAQNIGLLTTHRLRRSSTASRAARRSRSSEFTRGLDPISAAIVEHGGLFAYNRARLAGEVVAARRSRPRARPMTLCEKILASHVDRRRQDRASSASPP